MQDLRDLRTVVGVEAVARQADDGRDEAVERVGSQEHPDPLALAEPEDPDRDPQQILTVDLEQRVSLEGLADLDQRLRVVAVGREPGVLEHVGDLFTDDRDLQCAGLVGGGRVQPEEAALAGNRAVGVVALDPDVVEVHRPVHG